MAYTMMFYTVTSESVLLAAIESGKVKYPSYVMIKDTGEDNTIRLVFIDKGNVIKNVKNDSKQYVKTLDILPDINEGELDTIYLVGKNAYIFDGEEFVSLGVDNTADIKKLNDKIDAVDEKAKHFYEKIEYEIVYAPVGTIVNYRDKEIRVMCPTDTEWVLQQSGEGADPNSFYIGAKIYAPSNDVVNFKEDLAEIITDTTMYSFEDNDFAGIDEYGRKYSIVWLPVAIYQNGVWTYNGAKSTTKHYVGWYYSVEWYDANGVMIASDCIRINLSNEECHSAIEPYYMANVMSDVNSSVVEVTNQVESITENLTTLEEKITNMEESDNTNIEKITTLETANEELTNKVSELEDAIAKLEEESTFVELE